MSSTARNKEGSGRFDFLKYGKFFTVVSVVLVTASLLDIFIQGFDFGIDFVGGTEVQIQFTGGEVSTAKVREFTDEIGYQNANVQKIGEEGSEYLIRVDTIEGETDEETNQLLNAMMDKLTSSLKTSFPGVNAEIRRVDTVGPQVGDELKKNAMLAIVYSLILILVYIGLRFDYKYAPGAVFCLFHDAIIVLGIFAVFNMEVNVQTLAAVLTVIGYSLNDTIIIFDRIRENEKLYRDKSFRWICNQSINDTISRTILTSLTTLMAVGAMYFLAGGVIEDFSFALGLGIVIGTYSTIYVATPLVIFLDRLQRAQKEKIRATA